MHLLKTSLPHRQSGYTIRSAATLEAQRSAGLEPFAVTPFGFPPARDGVPVAGEETVGGIVYHRLQPGRRRRRRDDHRAAVADRDARRGAHAH